MSTKPGPERAEHLDHCKETMQQRDRNPARPNGPQDDVNALQGTKFHGQTNDPSQNTLCTWEGEPRKKKEGHPHEGPMKTCSRRLMAKHATAQNNPVKPRRTGVQQELEEKTNLRKRSRNGTQVQKHGRNALEKNQKEPHM